MPPRPYTQRARAEAVESRRDEVLAAAVALFMERPYDALTFAALAERSGVSLKTITRQFGSKEALFTEALHWSAARESARRAVPAGDLPALVATLADRYESIAERVMRRVAIEDRVPAVREAADNARRSHLAWLAEAFAPALPPEGDPQRRVALAALFTATEIYSWWSVRHLGFSREEAAAAMLTTLEGLVQSMKHRSLS